VKDPNTTVGIVTEIGVFGDLPIDDPTAKEILTEEEKKKRKKGEEPVEESMDLSQLATMILNKQ